MKNHSKIIPTLLTCLLGSLAAQKSQADEYTTLTGERVAAALAKGGGKKDIQLAEGSLTALGWFVLYGNDKTSADLADKLAGAVTDVYNGTEKMDLYMKHTSTAYGEMLNLNRFKGKPVNPSAEYAKLTKERVERALAKGAGEKEFKLAEGSLCALGWFTLHGNDEQSLALAKKLMNAAAAAWPGANEVYHQQSISAYAEMINLGRFKADGGGGKPAAAGGAANNELRVDAYKKVTLALISEAEAKDKEFGWWDVWTDQKKAKAKIQSPHVFKALQPGIYTLIAYDPASANFDPNGNDPDEQSDGVVLEKVTITADCKLSYSFKKSDFKEWNCLSCPWLYVDSGEGYARITEVLKDVVGLENQTTTSFTIEASAVVDGVIKIRLQEEKDEITRIDRCVISIAGVDIAAKADTSTAMAKLASSDGNHLILKKGDSIDLEFALPNDRAATASIVLKTTGYYEPDSAFLDAIYKKYLRSTPQGG